VVRGRGSADGTPSLGWGVWTNQTERPSATIAFLGGSPRGTDPKMRQMTSSGLDLLRNPQNQAYDSMKVMGTLPTKCSPTALQDRTRGHDTP